MTKPRLQVMALAVTLTVALFIFVPVALQTTRSDRENPFSFHALSAYAAGQPDGRVLFEQKCKACHTIGGGRGVGPDLKGISSKRDRDWLVRFITTPDKLIAQGDPVARQIVQEYGLPMPNVGVSDEGAKAILAFIDGSSGSTPLATTAPPASPVDSARAASDSSNGSQLFTGRMSFQNGGPSCLSCHNVNGVSLIGGGTVGKDLTASYSLMGEAGLTVLLKTAPFPMMKAIYSAKPLTDDEIASLVVFLKEAGAQPVTSAQNSWPYFVVSAAGALVVIGAFQFLWRGRLSGVRRPLVKGGSK